MRNLIATFLIIATVLLCATPSYGQDVINKLGRGVANLFTGWIEFPKEIINVTSSDGDVKGLFVAPIVGLWKALGRTFVGLYEIVTFPIPLPAGYEPIVYPEYVIGEDDLMTLGDD